MTEQDSTASVGAYLRSLRQARQGSLEEMARVTRVSAYQLEALERDRFSELPAPVFVKGFIRAYCHFLSEPPEEALRRYREGLGEHPAPVRPAPPRRSALAWTGSPVFISFALLLVFGLGLLTVNAAFKRGARARAIPEQPVAISQPLAPRDALVVASPVAPAAAESAAPHRLVVRAIEPTWIRVQADDLHAVEELLPPGATREWTAERRFLLTVGNAGGIEIELNGQPIPRLGKSGAVIRQLELPRAAAGGS
jgi:cytoskeleton protein RodZ